MEPVLAVAMSHCMRGARHVRGERCGLPDDPEDLPIHVCKRGLVTLRKELLP